MPTAIYKALGFPAGHVRQRRLALALCTTIARAEVALSSEAVHAFTVESSLFCDRVGLSAA